MVVHWRKLGEVENECTLHNFVVLAISMPNIIEVSKNLTNLWQKQFWLFFLRHGVDKYAVAAYHVHYR